MGSVKLEDIAVRVVAEVCSVYPERNEALINAGILALSKATSKHHGYGLVVDKPGWHVRDISQEHGIISWNGENGAGSVEETFKVGDKILLYVPNSGITAGAHPL